MDDTSAESGHSGDDTVKTLGAGVLSVGLDVEVALTKLLVLIPPDVGPGEVHELVTRGVDGHLRESSESLSVRKWVKDPEDLDGHVLVENIIAADLKEWVEGPGESVVGLEHAVHLLVQVRHNWDDWSESDDWNAVMAGDGADHPGGPASLGGTRGDETLLELGPTLLVDVLSDSLHSGEVGLHHRGNDEVERVGGVVSHSEGIA